MSPTQAKNFRNSILDHADKEVQRMGLSRDDVNVTVHCKVMTTETHDMHDEAEQ